MTKLIYEHGGAYDLGTNAGEDDQHLWVAPSDLQASVASAAVREKLLGIGFQSSWLEGSESLKVIQAQSATTAELVRTLGLKTQ